MSSTYSPGQSPGSSRLLQLGVAGSASRLRSSSSKKPPEPLRRAVADCLSSSPPPANSHHGAIPSMAPSEALRNLRMCDILFSQLCLKVLSTDEDAVPNLADRNSKFETSHRNSYKESMDEADTRPPYNNVSVSTCETASMAAMLLRGQAIVPMQLVARVPAALFYWPLIQLAGAATDNIALGVAVGSKGRRNIFLIFFYLL